MFAPCVVVAFLISSCVAFGQGGTDVSQFEVASIKPVDGPVRELFVFSASGPRMALKAYTVKQMVEEAYGVKQHQVVVPKNAPNTLYDVTAIAREGSFPTRAEFRKMLQLLLADRCKLKLHREMKEMPVYALTVGKNGPKFKESATAADPPASMTMQGKYQAMNAKNYTMSDLIDTLRNYTDHPVLDNTGLTGAYDIQLRATFGYNADTSDLSALSILDAVQEQLGLKLTLRKATVEVIVVDYFERPSAN